jgi:hypothetical protein
MGLDRWVQQQLDPDSIDDSTANARLGGLPVLQLSPGALLNEYPPEDVAAKRLGLTVEEYWKRQQELAHPPQGAHAAPSTEPQEVLNELTEAKLLRAIYSERQLEE